MHFHLRVHHWVVWWVYVGVICGAAAVVNILVRRLTHAQEAVILIIGALYWIMGGLLCWAWEGVQIHRAVPIARHDSVRERISQRR